MSLLPCGDRALSGARRDRCGRHGRSLRLVKASLRASPSLSVDSREILFPDLRLDESDNHPNYDIHPNGDRFVMPELETSGGLVAVFDWVSILRDRRRSPAESR